MSAKRNRWHFLLLSGLLLCGPMGCWSKQDANSSNNGDAPSERDTTRHVPTAPGARDSSPADSTIALREVGKAEYEQQLRTHQGHVVLVDFWATWCVPCKKKFPQILNWRQQYAARGLDVMSVSIDDPSERAEVLAQLQKWNATIDNLISRWGAGSESAKQFEFDGAVPFYKLYDRTGRLRYQFSGLPQGLEGVEPLEQLEPRIVELLGNDS